jgi:hypothetical protein
MHPAISHTNSTLTHNVSHIGLAALGYNKKNLQNKEQGTYSISDDHFLFTYFNKWFN